MPASRSERKAGRPRSETARQAVLAAAYRIVTDEGLGRLTVERVATETGVGKPTIYRYWANAHELAMAAFIAEPTAAPTKRRGPPAQQLRAHLRTVIKAFSTPRGRQITLTLASAEHESELVKAFRNQVILQSRELGRQIIEAAIHDGSARPTIDVEAALDMLYGPLFFRLLAGHEKLTDTLAVRLVEILFDGIGAPEKTS